MNTATAISFEGVFKSFPRHTGQALLRERLLRILFPARQPRFYALKDVSFEVARGEAIGIIGHNGAGKSTLLSLATGLARPDQGKIEVRGRMAALLELGSGFHPDLTGGENIWINAALLGLSRQEARARYHDIIEFSGIGDFIGEPLRTYSAGMVMRLAFSVAVNVNPDILVIDEVLGVGDQAFFEKCVEKIMEFRQGGKTLLCVSHALDTLLELCDTAVWLDHGSVVEHGPVARIVQHYQAGRHAASAKARA
jgi:ABC-type polysaccharide/polyol phosphate transport system ATPase subunit